MKKYIIIFLAGISTAVFGQNRGNETPLLTRSLTSEQVKSVEVKTSGGSISVVGVPADQARIEVFVRGNNGQTLSKEELKSRLEESYNVNISVSDSRVVAQASPKLRNISGKRSLSISFKVYAPEKVSTRLNTSGGSISLSNLEGIHDFATSGGSLSLNQVRGDVKGRTSGGSIRASASRGKIDLSTSGGSIDLQSLSGTIQARTSGGSVKATGISGELRAHTSGGSIRLSDLTCSVDAGTSGGQMDVSIAKVGEFVKLGNSGGNINVEILDHKGLNLEIKGNKVTSTALKNFNGERKEDRIEGKLNGGGVPVTINSGSGRVNFAVR